MSDRLQPIADQLCSRRVVLGMSFPSVAARSQLKIGEVKRVLSRRIGEASAANVLAVAEAMGVSLDLIESDPAEFLRQQARRKAEWVARLVQGSSALDGKAVDDSTYDLLIENSERDLLAGSRRRLWAR